MVVKNVRCYVFMAKQAMTSVADKEGEVGVGSARHSHVRTVGMRAANMRKSMEKKRKPELLRTFLASFPIPK